jgi:hypothetical protein
MRPRRPTTHESYPWQIYSVPVQVCDGPERLDQVYQLLLHLSRHPAPTGQPASDCRRPTAAHAASAGSAKEGLCADRDLRPCLDPESGA